MYNVPRQRSCYTTLLNRVKLLLLGAAVVGIAFSGGIIVRLAPGELCGSDYAVFYAGGQLVGTPQLYSAAAAQAIQKREMGCTSPSAMFVRLPYFAAMMRPWSKLPFWTSFALWRMASIVSLGVFIWLWPGAWQWPLLACAWSLPVAFAIANGQDICFLLMVLAVAQSFWMKGAAGKAGATLALCAAKFHLFLLMPLVFWPGMKRAIYSMALGGALLLGVCFAVQGPDWPRQFLAAALDRRIDPAPEMLFNLRGLAQSNAWLEAAFGGTALAAAFYVIRHGGMGYKLSIVLVNGLLLSHHQTLSDAALLIPAALTLAVLPAARYTKFIAIFLVSPVGCVLLTISTATARVASLLLLALAWLMAWEVKKVKQFAQARTAD